MFAARRRAVPILVVTLSGGLLAACEATEQEPCMYNAEHNRHVPLGDDSLIGFSGNDVLASVNEQGTGSLTWISGEEATVSLEVTGGSEAVVFFPPPEQGFCDPDLSVRDATVRVRTTDNKLDVEFAGSISEVGYDGVIEVIFPTDARHTLGAESAGLPIPATWRSEQRPSEELLLNFRVQVARDRSPYCTMTEQESLDPNEDCSVYAGRIIFYGSDPDADTHSPEDARFSSALAWWTWDN